MTRWGYATVGLVIASVVAQVLGLDDLIVFLLSTASLIPAAGLIGRATEALTHHVGPRFGGLLNATFGNASELIITAFAIHSGLLTLVKASITGSIIGNTLFVLGSSLLLGGSRYHVQSFDPREATRNATMMILAVAGLYLPAMLSLSVSEPSVLERLSLLVAGVLLVTYLAYLGFTVLRPARAGRAAPPPSERSPAGAIQRSGSAVALAEQPDRRPHDRRANGQAAPPPESGTPGPTSEPDEEPWSLGRSILLLALGAAAAAIGSEFLVDTIEPVTERLGLSELFVGVIVVPIVGNAAEHLSAVQQAWRNRLEATLAITAGSSTQIALFVAPTLVFLSLLLGHPLDLLFSGMELMVLGLATAIFGYISLDGESNWLEGVQLLALYVMAALAFFVIPAGL